MNTLVAHSPQNRRIGDILVPVAALVRARVALKQFLLRAIARRYRLSAFGFLWSIIVPLFTLAVYTFVFGYVMHSRWDDGSGGTGSYSLQLFAGLVVFWFMAEVVGQSPNAIVEHTNLVKKAVFPLEIIPAVIVGNALFHALINTAVLLAATLLLRGEIHATALLFPLILVPFALLLVGFAWILAAIGVYFRDLVHLVGLLMTGILFLSPVFYSIDRLSPRLQTLMTLNPVAFIVPQARRVLIQGELPDWAGLALYFAVAWIVASLGIGFFNYARKNFADVL